MEKYFLNYRNKFMEEYTCGELIIDDDTPDLKTLVNDSWINVIDMARAFLTLIFENFQNSRESKLAIFSRLSIEDVKAYYHDLLETMFPDGAYLDLCDTTAYNSKWKTLSEISNQQSNSIKGE